MNQIRAQELLNLCMQVIQKSKAYINFSLASYAFVMSVSIQEDGFDSNKKIERYYFRKRPEFEQDNEHTYYTCRNRLIQLIQKAEKEIHTAITKNNA